MSKDNIFARWQPVYAEHNIPTFPCRSNKRPAVRNYGRFGLPASTKIAQASDANAFGFMCGPRSNVTVLDVNSTIERVLVDALDRHGKTPILTRSGSGKYHAWYSYNGERRRIRPDRTIPIDILGLGGYVVAPPSHVTNGDYQFIEGSLDDLGNLPTLQNAPANNPSANGNDIGNDIANPLRGMREHDGRNKKLFMTICPAAREIHAIGGGKDALFDVAMSHNGECEEPMTMQEVQQVVDNVWQYTIDGRNYIGIGNPEVARRRARARQEEVAKFKNDADAFYLLEFLRVNEGISSEFWITNGLAAVFGWPLRRLVTARKGLLAGRYIRQVRPAMTNKPAIYAWIFRGKQK